MADHQATEGSSKSKVSGGDVEETVQLNVKTLDSQIYSFCVDKNMPVSLFKEKIAIEVGLPVERQRLIFRGKVLKNDHLLSEYHVEDGHTLHLVARQPTEPSAGASSAEASGQNATSGTDASNGPPRNRFGQVSHSVVLGTLNLGEQGNGGIPDLNRVIGAVLNSIGIGGQNPAMSTTAQPSMQEPQGNVTGSAQDSVVGYGNTTNRPEPTPLPSLALRE
uniref:Ubiquitin-like domain-containing protein n=1 Tax=Kalanchoe fedtschenkoi TaxID=63787 RepID=A0A7N0U3Y4_KALFE